MTYEETIAKLKQEFLAAQKLEVEGVTHGAFQQLAMQTVHEIERRRIDCTKQAENLRAQAAAAEHQAAAFSIVGSVMLNIVHGFVANRERQIDEELRQKKAADEAAADEAAERHAVPSVPPAASESSDGASETEAADKPKKAPPKKK